MSDAIYAVILALGGFCAVGFAIVMTVVPRIEARERRRELLNHPAAE